MITIYTSDGCGKCKDLKNYCETNNFKYIEVSIINNRSVLEKLKNNKVKQLPAIEIDNIIYSLTLSELRNIIKEKGESDV